MSKIADFYAKVIADANLRAKANEILGGKAVADLSDAELQKLADFAKAEGCDVTVAEVKDYFTSDNQELSDEALDAVAGGYKRGYGSDADASLRYARPCYMPGNIDITEPMK